MSTGTLRIAASASEVGTRRRPIVWAPLVVAVLAGAGTTGLVVANGRLALPVGVAVSVAYTGAGSWIAAHRPGHRLVPVLWVVGATQGLVEASHAYATRALDVAPGALPGGAVAAWLSDWLWFPGYLLMVTLVLLLFPDGRLPSRRWRPVVWATVGAIGLMVAGALTTVPTLAGRAAVTATGEGEGVAEVLGAAALLIGLACAVPCLGSLALRWRRAVGVEQQQIKIFLLGAVTSVALLVALLFADGAMSAPIGLLAAVAVPVAIGVAVLRHHLFDVDVVVNRTLVYLLLTGLVVIVYVAVVGAAAWLFDLSGTLPSIVAAGAVAAAFQPARERTQRGVNRLLYGRRDDPYHVLRALGQRLGQAARLSDVLPDLAACVADTLRVPHVRIEVPGPLTRTVAQHGEPVEGAQRLPLVNQRETVGWLVVAPRAGESTLAAQDLRLLEDLAHPVAAAVRASLLTEDVQRSREALRLALEDERRRIRRDVHDGLGPALATVVVGLERLRNLGVERDPGAEDLLAALKEQAQQALGGMRALVDGLRPSVLDDLGLSDALRSQAQRATSSTAGRPFVVTVQAPESLPELPAAVEVAAYRIAMEALTNAVRHASATTCSLRLEVGDDLRLEVRDDGVGLPSGYTAGVGLRSIRERAAELGGSATVHRLSPGTRVFVTIPLQP